MSIPVNASDLDGMLAVADPEVGSPEDAPPEDAPPEGAPPEIVPGGVVTPGGPSPPPSGASDRDAPAAGFAVMISGTTQATAPAVATADLRPNACRLEMVRPDGASPGAAGWISPSRFDPCRST